MKVYKLEGKTRCAECGENAELYLDVLDTPLCKKCGVKLYKELGFHFVPRAVPNVILRSEKQDAPLSHLLYKDKDEKDADKGKVEDNKAKDNHPTKGNLTKDERAKSTFPQLARSTKELSTPERVRMKIRRHLLRQQKHR
ncbi:MAG: hypothetical protein IJ978_04805 [Clostridia bacterium]|nr:hypothetical protein [Clostridia bacterium]MBR2918549.1 hypothetical protein [Clostridia bacterium]